MRYFLAFIVNDLSGEFRVLPLMDRREKTVEQLMVEARQRTGWEDAGVELVEIDAPPVATWRLMAHVPVEMRERVDEPFVTVEELRFRRMMGS